MVGKMMGMVSFDKAVGTKTKPVLVFLHGWPGEAKKWGKIIELLGGKYTSYALDLPGWGKTPLSLVYTLFDYASEVAGFIKKESLENVVLIGHSFGGRVAIKLVANRLARMEKLILIASAGVERKNWKVKLIKTLTPFIPQYLRDELRAIVGSRDYLQADGVKRETFVNIISENLESDLPKIQVPTLLVWGRDDHTTPLWQGELMHKLIPGSKFCVIDGDHGIPYRKAEEVAKIIMEFLGRDAGGRIQDTGKDAGN